MKYSIETTRQFDKWFAKQKDNLVRIRVLARLGRAENGNFGDIKPLTANLFEMRFFFGSGLRIYYTIKNDSLIILLTGGDKSSQKKDIAKAQEFLAALED